MGIEGRKQRINGGLGTNQKITEKPDRFRIGNPTAQIQIWKAHEGKTVADLKLRLIVRQMIERQKNQEP